MTQRAFTEACGKFGYRARIVGTDGPDIAGTIALAEMELATGNVAGMAVWTGSPAWDGLIAKAAKDGVPVVLPHFPVPEGSVPGARGIIGCDVQAYAREAAEAIGKAIGGTGVVAVTQGSFNTTENTASETFAKAMQASYPQVKVLTPQEEGFDPPKAITRATAILLANPDVAAAFSTTGGGPTTWAGAQKEAGRKLVIVGMDYTRVNLDLVKSGDVFAVVGQPLWEEAYGTVELLDKMIRGEPVPWWTRLPAPLITKDKLDPYYELLGRIEATLRK
jgi:ribose transport system substrate-binding protein